MLSTGEPRSASDIVKVTGLSDYAVWDALYYWWKKGRLVRSEKPVFEGIEVFKGRGGVKKTTRAFYLYALKPENKDSIHWKGHNFVSFSEEYLDSRGGKKVSKAKKILDFIKENSDRAFFSNEIVKAMSESKIKAGDIMSTVRRYERLVYVRGYRTDQRQTPFKEGYILTWIDKQKPRDSALEEAIQKTNKILENRSATNPIVERIHIIRDAIIESTKLRDLLSSSYLQNKIGCSENELDHALERTLQLYPDLKEVKLFNAYRYYYHSSLTGEDLQAVMKMKENYIRIIKGRDNRVGHNWEAIPEWFIDISTTGAKFWTQKHRTENMDSRRITLHLLKPVGGRRNNAEADRIWEVTPGIFAQPITYVLECKWGLIQKRYVDDFFEVLRWSKEFGTDTPDGRQVKQGVLGVFSGSAFNPKESVKLKDETEISLATYAARMNIQLLKASDFNEKLHERGVQNGITVQRICKTAKNEKEVRQILEALWNDPEKGEEILSKVAERNVAVYEFEKMLENDASAR